MKKEIENWLRQSEDDLDSAKKNIEIRKYYVSSFLSQQSVEKSLKALVLKKEGKLIKTHNVSKLGKILNIPKELLIKITHIEPVYQETRYPDVASKTPSEEFEEKDAVEFFNIAQEVLEWVKKMLI